MFQYDVHRIPKYKDRYCPKLDQKMLQILDFIAGKKLQCLRKSIRFQGKTCSNVLA